MSSCIREDRDGEREIERERERERERKRERERERGGGRGGGRVLVSDNGYKTLVTYQHLPGSCQFVCVTGQHVIG